MKFRYSPNFKASFRTLSDGAKRRFYKQADYLLSDLRHPSLHAKKYDEGKNIWQARVTKSLRLYFLIEGDTYILLDIETHPK